MIERAQVVDAVANELGERAGACTQEHVEVGNGVADRLGLLHIPSTLPAPAHPLDALGCGAFIRRISDWPIEVVARFKWVCVMVIEPDRGARNRDHAWYADARAAGVTITTFDALPSPRNYRIGLADAVGFSREVGAICYVIDAEKEYRGASEGDAHAIIDDVARLGGDACPPGFTSFPLPSAFRDLPWRPFVSRAALTIPQPYDRDHKLDPNYAINSVEAYRRLGATRIAVGRGAHRRDDPATPSTVEAWRTPAQIVEHRATTPKSGTVGECWWFPAGQPKGRIVDAIVT